MVFSWSCKTNTEMKYTVFQTTLTTTKKTWATRSTTPRTLWFCSCWHSGSTSWDISSLDTTRIKLWPDMNTSCLRAFSYYGNPSKGKYLWSLPWSLTPFIGYWNWCLWLSFSLSGGSLEYALFGGSELWNRMVGFKWRCRSPWFINSTTIQNSGSYRTFCLHRFFFNPFEGRRVELRVIFSCRWWSIISLDYNGPITWIKGVIDNQKDGAPLSFLSSSFLLQRIILLVCIFWSFQWWIHFRNGFLEKWAFFINF